MDYGSAQLEAGLEESIKSEQMCKNVGKEVGHGLKSGLEIVRH